MEDNDFVEERDSDTERERLHDREAREEDQVPWVVVTLEEQEGQVGKGQEQRSVE